MNSNTNKKMKVYNFPILPSGNELKKVIESIIESCIFNGSVDNIEDIKIEFISINTAADSKKLDNFIDKLDKRFTYIFIINSEKLSVLSQIITNLKFKPIHIACLMFFKQRSSKL